MSKANTESFGIIGVGSPSGAFRSGGRQFRCPQRWRLNVWPPVDRPVDDLRFPHSKTPVWTIRLRWNMLSGISRHLLTVR